MENSIYKDILYSLFNQKFKTFTFNTDYLEILDNNIQKIDKQENMSNEEIYAAFYKKNRLNLLMLDLLNIINGFSPDIIL